MNLSKIQRILVLRLDAIGDVILTTPFLRELRRNFHNAYISLVVNHRAYDLVKLCPYVSEVIACRDLGVINKADPLRNYLLTIWFAFEYLRGRRFELVLIPRWDIDWYNATLLAYLSGAKIRVGYSEKVYPGKALQNKGFDSFLTHPIDIRELKHEVERNLDVLRFLGLKVLDDSLELWTSEEDEDFAESFLVKSGIKREFLIAVAPGASWLRKRWPIERFLEVCRWILKHCNAKFLVLGGKGEEELGIFLEENLKGNVINLVSKITLRQAVALLKRTKLFIGNDSSPMHMAAACGVPIVAIFCHPKGGNPNAPNSPFRFGPWKAKNIVLQPEEPTPPCVDECRENKAHCILGVRVDQVISAVSSLLNGIIY